MTPMNEKDWSQFETQLRQTTQKLPYPATPDIAQAVGRRLRQQSRLKQRPHVVRLAVGFAVVVLFFAGLMAIPQVRAGVVDVLRIGALQIFVQETTPTPAATAVATPAPLSLTDLGELATIEKAQRQLLVPLQMPTYPAQLGLPDSVYTQAMLGRIAAVTMLWSATETHPQVALTQIAISDFGRKMALSEQVVATAVAEHPALWIEGPHPLSLRAGTTDTTITVESNVLLWSIDDVTYRLEGAISLDYALQIANSLQSIE